MTNVDFKKYLRYCKKYANHIFGYKHPDYEDAISEGLFGVVRALKKYNPDDKSKASLNTYITATIKNSIVTFRTLIENKKIAENGYMTSRDSIMDEYDIDIVSIADTSYKNIDSNEFLKIIEDFMNNYKDEKIKNIFIKIFKEDKTLTETSQELNIGIESIRMYRQKIIQMLRNHFKKLNHGEFK